MQSLLSVPPPWEPVVFSLRRCRDLSVCHAVQVVPNRGPGRGADAARRRRATTWIWRTSSRLGASSPCRKQEGNSHALPEREREAGRGGAGSEKREAGRSIRLFLLQCSPAPLLLPLLLLLAPALSLAAGIPGHVIRRRWLEMVKQFEQQINMYREMILQSKQQVDQIYNQIRQIQHAATTVQHGATNLLTLDLNTWHDLLALSDQLERKLQVIDGHWLSE